MGQTVSTIANNKRFKLRHDGDEPVLAQGTTITDLPETLLIEILAFCDDKTRLRCVNVNQRFRAAAFDYFGEFYCMDCLLRLAVTNGSISLTRFALKQGADVDGHRTNSEVPTRLHHAVRHKRIDIAQMLLEAGASPTIAVGNIDDRSSGAYPNCVGFTPLHWACTLADDPAAAWSLVELLLSHDEEGAKRAGYGVEHPLHLAIKSNLLEVVGLMIDSGSDPQSRNRAGLTAVLQAANEGNLDMVRFLIEKGANPWFQAGNGSNILHIMGSSSKLPVDKALELHEMLKGDTALVTCLEERDARRFAPLHTAAENGKLQLVKRMVEDGASTAARTDRGWTAQRVAYEAHQFAVATYLEEKQLTFPRPAANTGNMTFPVFYPDSDDFEYQTSSSEDDDNDYDDDDDDDVHQGFDSDDFDDEDIDDDEGDVSDDDPWIPGIYV